MEESIKKIADIANSKYENFFILNGKSSNLSMRIPTPINLDSSRNYKMGLKFFSVYNTIRNVTDQNNKIKYSKDGGTTWIDKTFEPGSYEAAELVKELGDVDANNKPNIDFEPYIPTNKFKLVLKNNRQVDFTIDKSIRNILGFNSKKYTTTTIAENKSNIENQIDIINIHCNIVEGGYFNGLQQNIIYSIPSFTVALGHKIIETPMKPIYLPITITSIHNIQLEIKDNNGNPIDFGEENITVQLHIKQI